MACDTDSLSVIRSPMNSSYEDFKIHSSAERYIWATYAFFVALSSILGDTVILLASRNRDSFRLNKFLVTIMQHIAVCDISVSITNILPSAISLIADSWVLGEALCFAQPYLSSLYGVNMYLVCVLTTAKFLLLRKPARARNWSKKQAHVICSVVWMSICIFPIVMFTLGKDDVSFDYRTYACEYGWNAYTWKRVQPVIVLISVIFTDAVMIATTVPTLKYLVEARKSARRTKKSVPWQGALTVSLTAIVCCVSTLPFGVYYFCRLISDQENRRDYLLYRYGYFFTKANISSNFFVYALTITSFRRFLIDKMREIPMIASKCKRKTGNDFYR